VVERLFEDSFIIPNSKNSIFPTNKHMAPLSLVAGDALVKLIASARSFRHNNPRGFFLACSFASFMLLFLLTATHYSDSFSSSTGVGTKDDEDAVLSYEEDEDEKSTREKTNDENNYQFENRSEMSGFLWWEGAANVALACACAATIGILVAARRARKIFLLSSSSSQQQQRVEGQSATAGIGKESGGGKSWNGSQWVDATAPSVLSSPYRNSSGGAAAAAARPPDANWAKAKGVGAWSSENGSKNNSNDNEDDGTDFATGFGYSEGVSSETARERAYRETLWARREAEELEAEENEEDQRNHHEYFTKNDDDDDDDDNRHRNRSNSSRKSSASTSSAPRKEKESAAAKRERRWSKFDQRWESLDASAATSRLPLTYNDIPWPPKMAKLLDRKVSEHEKKSSSSSSSAGGGSDAATAAAKKKIYRELLLRWHPDKFMQKYGKRVRAGGDEDRIKERVDAVAKALSASMAS